MRCWFCVFGDDLLKLVLASLNDVNEICFLDDLLKLVLASLSDVNEILFVCVFWMTFFSS